MKFLFKKYRQGRLPLLVRVPITGLRLGWIYAWYGLARLGWLRRRLSRGGRKREEGLHTGRLESSLCTQEQHESPTFVAWARRMGEEHSISRKQWEFCFIAQALHERGLLRPGARGLGFGVGKEPLPALFASLGCEIVATDIGEDYAREAGWVETNQHASTLEELNERRVCPPDEFRKRVSWRVADMTDIDATLRGFDFVWSACALEHLGSIENGIEFVVRSLDCLRPGGVAVHTTEFNLAFESFTPDHCETVAFRRRDLAALADRLHAGGHRIVLDLDEGTLPFDRFVDLPPYRRPHLRLMLFSYFYSCISTSVGLIVEKAP